MLYNVINIVQNLVQWFCTIMFSNPFFRLYKFSTCLKCTIFCTIFYNLCTILFIIVHVVQVLQPFVQYCNGLVCRCSSSSQVASHGAKSRRVTVTPAVPIARVPGASDQPGPPVQSVAEFKFATHAGSRSRRAECRSPDASLSASDHGTQLRVSDSDAP